MKTHRISIATDFSTIPIGRYLTDSSTSGQAFREDLLIPLFEADGNIIIDLDGTEGYGSSFLEEAFGGLIRRGVSAAEIASRLTFESKEDPTLVDEIQGYIQQAASKKEKK